MTMLGSEQTGLGSVPTGGSAVVDDEPLFDVLESDEVGLLVGSTNNEFEPALRGRYFVPIAMRWVITAIAGGAPAVGVGGNVGNNVAKTNVVANTANFMTVAQLGNAFAGGAPWVGVTAMNTTTTTMVDGANPFKFDVTTPASGGGVTLLRARLLIYGAWVRL